MGESIATIVTGDHEIDMQSEIFCALLVPIINQLWVCTADNKLVIFNPGCYDNYEKHNIPDVTTVLHGNCRLGRVSSSSG